MKKPKFESIVFYNNFNNGDLHYVRSLIRYVMKEFPDYSYSTRHPRHQKVLGDLRIPHKQVPLETDMSKKFDRRGYFVAYNTLNFNTQLLVYNNHYFNQTSATIITLRNIFAHTLKEVFDYDLHNRIVLFLPEIDYTYYNIKGADTFLSEHPERKVLICNNDFESEQGIKNMDFEYIIQSLSNMFPDISFIISNPTQVKSNNIFQAKDILGDCNGCDLNEIAYISEHCHTIIGRYSGPHTFTYTKNNLLNVDKNIITFCTPSTLYGLDPTKWSDFGTKSITDTHAKFYNIIGNSDGERILEISKIISSF